MSDKVPAEFLGKARVFRANMISAVSGVGAQMAAIRDYSFGLYKRRNSPPRPWHLLEIEQKWRSMPAAGCLRLAVQRDKRSMLIADTRITAAKAKNLEWGGASEISICLVESSLALSKRQVETKAATVAAVSLHAMGRWYQRAFATNDYAMMHDLALVVTAASALVTEAADAVRVPSPNGGSWRGAVVETLEGNRIVNVRTFL
jgi:hypothetical protein